MGFIEEIKSSSSFVLDRDKTGGIELLVADPSNNVVAITVDALTGILTTAIVAGRVYDPWVMRGDNGNLYKVSANANLTLLTTETPDENWKTVIPTVVASTGEEWLLSINTNDTLETTSA